MHRLPSFPAALCLAAVSIATLTGCQSTPASIPSVLYKMEVVQGNFVSSEQVGALRAGMAKAQVKNILGTPLLTDIFHADRWDYIFTIAKDGKAQPPRKMTVFFKGESLDRWEGDTMPSEAEFVKTLASGRKLEKAPPLEATEKQLAEFAKQQARTASSPTASAPTAGAAQPVASKTYPPLEGK